MTSNTPSKARLKELLEALSYEERPVVLASGASSNQYVDCKQTALHPEGALALGHHLYSVVNELETSTGKTALGVGGMSIGADPLATATSLAAFSQGRHLPAYLVRKEPKGHGTQEYLEGMKNIPVGSDVVLVEDVITTGGSTLRAAGYVRDAGLNPIGVAVIIDREVGGMKRLEEDGLNAIALFRLSEFGQGND
jgi:orotate phosphoribosyltransferase